MLLSLKSNYPVGLDISDLSIKLVQLNKAAGKIKIQALGKINLPQGIIENGEIIKTAEAIRSINKLITSPQFGKVSSTEIIASLPESKTFIKLVAMPKAATPVKDSIGAEIEKHIPLAINEIYYDWQVIEDQSDKRLVLIGAAPQNIVNQYSALLDEAKLSITALEIEPISLCRCLLAEETPAYRGQGQNNYGILDIGAKRTSLTVYSKNTILFTVSMPISGNKISEKIAKTLAISKEQAEKAKIICGLDEDKASGIIKKLLDGMIKELIKKINQAIEFYHHHYSNHGPLTKILLCGGGANIKNIAGIISAELNLAVKTGDALNNLTDTRESMSNILSEKHSLELDFLNKKQPPGKKNKTISIVQDSSLTFTTAIGLALRGVFVDEFYNKD